MADQTEQDLVRYQRRSDGLWDWHLFARNGEQLCRSDQGYTTKSDAARGFNSMVTLVLSVVTERALEQIESE